MQVKRILKLLIPALNLSLVTFATTYHVGPGQMYQNISDVPIELFAAGDSLLIYYRPAPYKEKFVIGATGTQSKPVVIAGISSGNLKPIIEGVDAITRIQLDFWSETRGIIKIGGTSYPSDNASWVEIRNLEIRSARPGFTFTDDAGSSGSYASNAAAVFVEKGQNITISNCDIHDCGNGIFVASQASDVIIDHCYIYDNGIEGSIYEHNTYTESKGITYQFNHFGRLRTGCLGNNLKDRSAGTVIRYNWIEGGNRQLDLVESDYAVLTSMPAYSETFVYGNVFLEYDGEGNSQIIHYGGDGGNDTLYRKGTLYLFYNTIISFRTGNTTLLRLSTNDEFADIRNNVVYVTNGGSSLAILNSEGTAELRTNWLNTGWRKSHSNPSANVLDIPGNLTGTNPVFRDVNGDDYYPDDGSLLINNAGVMHTNTLSYTPLYSFDTPVPTFRNRADYDEIGAYSRIDVTTSADIYKQELKGIRVYPNPTRDNINIDFPSSDETYLLQLYDALGVEVWNRVHTENRVLFNKNKLSPGIYYLKVTGNKKQYITKLFFE